MKRMPQSLMFAAMAMILPLAVWAQGSIATAPITAVERAALSPTRALLEQGKSVANTACVNCHGLNGISTDPGMPRIAAQRVVYLYRMLREYQGRERLNDNMNHAVGFLSDDALLAVAAYYASLNPPPAELPGDAALPSVKDSSDPFAGIRDSMKKCVKCHGEDGNSSASGMPNLTAQDPAYFVAAMDAYADKQRNHKLMTRLVGDLDEQTIANLGVFYAVQVPKRSETEAEGNADKGRLLAEPCSACHGTDGNASGKDMPTIAGQDARYFVKAMQAYQDGVRQHEKMFEASEHLSKDDMADLAAWYTAQEPVRRNVRAPLTAGEWITRCERCHGIDGNSTDPRFPMLAGQNEIYLANALQAYAGVTRSSGAMHAMAEPLTSEDIAQIARHYATQTPRGVVYMQLPCDETSEE